MKKNIFAIDFTKNTISASKSALKKASNPNTDEHTELMNLLALHPTFKVCEKAPNTKKTTYKGMGFKMMEDYIRTQEKADELMGEFNAAKSMFNGSYPLVKKWFLDKFKVSEAKKAIADEKVKRVKATVKKAPALHAANPAA